MRIGAVVIGPSVLTDRHCAIVEALKPGILSVHSTHLPWKNGQLDRSQMDSRADLARSLGIPIFLKLRWRARGHPWPRGLGFEPEPLSPYDPGGRRYPTVSSFKMYLQAILDAYGDVIKVIALDNVPYWIPLTYGVRDGEMYRLTPAQMRNVAYEWWRRMGAYVDVLWNTIGFRGALTAHDYGYRPILEAAARFPSLLESFLFCSFEWYGQSGVELQPNWLKRAYLWNAVDSTRLKLSPGLLRFRTKLPVWFTEVNFTGTYVGGVHPLNHDERRAAQWVMANLCTAKRLNAPVWMWWQTFGGDLALWSNDAREQKSVVYDVLKDLGGRF